MIIHQSPHFWPRTERFEIGTWSMYMFSTEPLQEEWEQVELQAKALQDLADADALKTKVSWPTICCTKKSMFLWISIFWKNALQNCRGVEIIESLICSKTVQADASGACFRESRLEKGFIGGWGAAWEYKKYDMIFHWSWGVTTIVVSWLR